MMSSKVGCVVCILAALVWLASGQAASGISIQTVISNAVRDYKDGKYAASISGFQKGLVHYRMLKHIDMNCGQRCNSPNISKELDIDLGGLDDLAEYGNMLAQANCIKVCKEEHPFSKSNIERPSDAFIADFERREPYNYLQFAYYKVGKIKEACQAAHTFLQVNPEDQQMLDNIAYYRDVDGVEDAYFTDLEEKPFFESFVKGVQAYEDKRYKDAIDSLEKCLYDYFNALEDCKVSCYVGKEPKTFPRFPMAIADRYLNALNCTTCCDDKLRPLVGDSLLDNFVAKMFSYLQFSYYQEGKWAMAVPAAASVLLLNPKDEMAESNYAYYTKHGDEHNLKPGIHYRARADAMKYHLEKATSEELLEMLHEAMDYNDEMEVEAGNEEEEDLGLGNLDPDIIEHIAQQITVTLGDRLRGDIG